MIAVVYSDGGSNTWIKVNGTIVASGVSGSQYEYIEPLKASFKKGDSVSINKSSGGITGIMIENY